MEKLVRASANYTAFSLVGGFYYRELTRRRGYAEGMPTQLRAFHGHCFSLGTFFFLIVLLLERSFKLSRQKHYKKFYVTYNIGLGVTLLFMLVHGTLTVLGKDKQHPSLVAWSAGVGHALLTVGFGYFFNVLHGAVRAASAVEK